MPTLDASTPARATNAGGTVVSPSFTAPSGAILLACISADSDGGSPQTTTVTDSGTLTWTLAYQANETLVANGGYAAVYWALTTSSVARTVQSVMAFVKPVSIKVLVWTSANTTTPVGAVNRGTSAVSPLDVGYTSTGASSRGIGVAMDWNNGSTGTSTDSNDIGAVSGTKDGFALWKAADTVTIGTAVTLDFQMTSTPSFTWVTIELMATGGAAGPNAHIFSFPKAIRRAALR